LNEFGIWFDCPSQYTYLMCVFLCCQYCNFNKFVLCVCFLFRCFQLNTCVGVICVSLCRDLVLKRCVLLSDSVCYWTKYGLFVICASLLHWTHVCACVCDCVSMFKTCVYVIMLKTCILSCVLSMFMCVAMFVLCLSALLYYITQAEVC